MNITEADNEMLKDRIKFLEEEIKILSERIIVRFDNGKCKCSQSVYEHIYKLEEENEKLKKGRDIMTTNYEKNNGYEFGKISRVFRRGE